MAEDDRSIPARYRARGLLRECQTLVGRLFEANESLVSRRGASGAASLSPPQVAGALVERQAALRRVVDELSEHQALHGALVALRAAVAREDARLAALAAALRAAENALQDAMDAAAPRVAARDGADKRPLDVADVVSYGNKIAPALAAPPAWQPGAPLGKSLPPAPPEDMMRAGRLAALANEGEEDGMLVE